MSPPVILIIGCGIAGPVLALLYKRKGYQPIVFEKVSGLGDMGASLMLMSNGMKVLDLIGLADEVKSRSTPITAFRDATSDGGLLGETDLPSTFSEKYGQPAVGVRRSFLNLILKQTLEWPLGVELRWGWELVDIREGDDSVTAVFDGGREVTGSFLVGCDGINSATRAALLRMKGNAEGAPVYTGLTQTSGISKTPEGLLEKPAMRNWYANGVHFTAYPSSETCTSWAITQAGSREAQETWRRCTQDDIHAQKQVLTELLTAWDPDVLRLVATSRIMVKSGLFDRDELQPEGWYSARCVLVGDAAHPTSPHLGQGVNQALEDCFHLSHSMPSLTPESEDYNELLSLLGSGLADTIFRPFATKRLSRISALVKAARVRGEPRLAAGEEAGMARNAELMAAFRDKEDLVANFDGLLREPFQNL